MNFIQSITFRFTLWYLAILTVLLTFLGCGVYFTLSRVLHHNLDDSLKIRADQLSRFRDIISIVAGGTFEEEIGEYVSFYYYSNGKLMHVSHKEPAYPVSNEQIDCAVAGTSSFSSVNFSGSRLRVYAAPFTPDNPHIRQRRSFRPGGFRHGMDTDADGLVSLAEMISHEKKIFVRTDTDGNGTISHDEMEKEETRRNQGRRPRPNDRFEKKDRDRDSVISLAEYLEDEQIRFRRLDADKDGQLSRSEMQRDRRPANDHRRPGPNDRRPEHEPTEIHSAALVVARPTKDIEMALERLLQILLFAIPLTIVFSGGGGVFLARRALKPVKEMTDMAQEIEDTDLSRRIGVSAKDELGMLASTLNQMFERLEKGFERQKQFTRDASHELRTPLAIILAEATLALQKERTVRAYQKSLEIIVQEADHMSDIISQLLALARADAGKEQLRFELIDLTEFIRDFCSDAKILCREKDIRLKADIADTISVKGDQRSLKRLMHNLISNAIRYTPGGGTVSVKLQNKDCRAVISVYDTGIGISSEDIPHIFERFFRVDKAHSRNDGGSGLGLAICKHIADIHGGSVSVESMPGKWSVFHVNLPLSEQKSEVRI